MIMHAVALFAPTFQRTTTLSCMAKNDPFRSVRPPLEPIAINAIQEVLLNADKAEELAQKAIEVRR